jgi:hypothetical protein
VVSCLYCEQYKPRSAFNREHVLPEGFGKYEDNLVLHDTVCKECNTGYFSAVLDGPLARDSKEGLDRFVHGFIEPKTGRRLGTRVAPKQRGGRFDGALLDWVVDPQTGTALKVRPARQLGFSRSEEGPFEWYRIEEVPSHEVLRSKGFSCCVAGGMSASEASNLIAPLGFKITGDVAPVEPPVAADGMIDLTMAGGIDQIILRAVAKIAFNYFAHRYRELAYLDQFRPIRRYIRFGEAPNFAPVTILGEPILGGLSPSTQIVGHIITTMWDPIAHRVIGQVSLFDWVQYRVTLSTSDFLVEPVFVASGHLFNPHGKQVAALTRDVSRATPFPLVTKEELAQSMAGGRKGGSQRPKRSDRKRTSRRQG